MATQNRMFLVCKTDDKYFCIGKYNSSSSWRSPNKNFLRDYNKFLEDHTHAYDQYGQDFELVYEKIPVVTKEKPDMFEEVFYHRTVGFIQNKSR